MYVCMCVCVCGAHSHCVELMTARRTRSSASVVLMALGVGTAEKKRSGMARGARCWSHVSVVYDSLRLVLSVSNEQGRVQACRKRCALRLSPADALEPRFGDCQ